MFKFITSFFKQSNEQYIESCRQRVLEIFYRDLAVNITENSFTGPYNVDYIYSEVFTTDDIRTIILRFANETGCSYVFEDEIGRHAIFFASNEQLVETIKKHEVMRKVVVEHIIKMCDRAYMSYIINGKKDKTVDLEFPYAVLNDKEKKMMSKKYKSKQLFLAHGTLTTRIMF